MSYVIVCRKSGETSWGLLNVVDSYTTDALMEAHRRADRWVDYLPYHDIRVGEANVDKCQGAGVNNADGFRDLRFV